MQKYINNYLKLTNENNHPVYVKATDISILQPYENYDGKEVGTHILMNNKVGVIVRELPSEVYDLVQELERLYLTGTMKVEISDELQD